MAIFEYTPASRHPLRAETIALRGYNRIDVESERHTLINMGMNAALRGEAKPVEVTRQLSKADTRRLPAEFVSRLLDPEYYEAPVIHSETGLAMYAPKEEGSPNFALLSEEVEDLEERLDSDTFKHFADASLVTHDALQLQPYISPDHKLSVRAHESFGYYVGNTYVPILTVLNPEHPVRQLIDQGRQTEPN